MWPAEQGHRSRQDRKWTESSWANDWCAQELPLGGDAMEELGKLLQWDTDHAGERKKQARSSLDHARL